MKPKKTSLSATERKQKYQKQVSDEFKNKLQDFLADQDYMRARWLWIIAITILTIGFLISVFTDFDGTFPRSGGLVICLGILFIFINLKWIEMTEEIYTIVIDLYTQIEQKVHRKAYQSKDSNETPGEIAKLRVDRVYPHFVNAVIRKLARNEGFILIVGTIVNVFGDIPIKYARLYAERCIGC